jgi:hypothetical protein
MITDFDKILNDLSYKVKDGMPNFENEQHLIKLWDVLKEHKWPVDERVRLLQNLTEAKEVIKPHADSKLIKKLGANKLSDEVINGIINGDYPDSPLSGAGSTYNVGKKKYTYDDIKKALSNQPDKKLFLTTAGTVIKVRSQYGERICHINVSKSDKPKKTYMGQISILYKTSKLSGVEVKDRVAAGIGYEKMQAENMTANINAMIPKGHTPLPLYIDGKDTGVDIDGAAKISGVPKADLAFGIKGTPNFYVSYKHGDYVDATGKELPASYQQYGSLKTFYNKQFNSAFAGTIIGKSTDKFLDTVIKQKDFTVFKGMTDVSVNKKGFIVIHQGKKKTTTKWTQKIQLWKPTRFKRVTNILKKKSKINAYFMDKSGWAVRRDLSKVPGGNDISLLAIFGKEYASGTAGEFNCNILMQDSAAFTVSMMTDEAGDAAGVNLEVSSQGHLMWNPKIYGGSSKFPKFVEPYKPYLVARYTGEMDIGWSGGSKFLFGARLLVMPKSQAKGKKDI